jgi:hypothetical protein
MLAYGTLFYDAQKPPISEQVLTMPALTALSVQKAICYNLPAYT